MTDNLPRPADLTPPGAQGLRRVRRWTGYALWSAAAFSLPLGLERLVVCPVLQRYLGEERFGSFVWLLGIMNLVSLATTAGFSNFLLRSFAATSSDRARAMLRMSLLLAVAISVPVVALVAIVSLRFADQHVRAEALALYAPLGVFAIFRCLGAVLIAPLRVRRRFGTIFALKALEGAILLATLLFAARRDLALIGGVYIASALLPLAFNAYMSRADIGSGAWFSSGLSKALLVAWVGLAIPALIEQSLANSPRIVLGAMQGSAAVTVLFAAASIGNMFVIPVGMAGGVVLSLLASKTEFVLAGRRGYLYLAAALSCALVIGALSYLAGTWLVRLLYPAVAAQAVTFYPWIALANTATAGIVLIRPVALKYARIRNVAALSLVTLILQWLALVLLIPAFGPAGAAAALSFSAFAALSLWVGCYVLLVRDPQRAAAYLNLRVTETA
jgi:O-antigen/teichoic acid export membrane protein